MLIHICLLLLLADPPQTSDLLKQGLSALQHGNLTEARTDLEQASKADPKNPFVWTSLAETYLRLQDRDRAMSAASTAEKLGKGNPVVAHALAIFYFDAAKVLLHQEKFTEAADVLTTALQHHPDDAQLTVALGVARYGQRRFDDAIELFLKTIRLEPDAEQPYAFLSKMLDQAGGHLPEITSDFERWAASNRSSGTAQLVLAKALLAADPRSERALELLRKAVELEPDNWDAHYELGALLESKHEYQDAAKELAAAEQLDPKQPMPHYHLARVYDRLGQADKARTEREIHSRLTNTTRNSDTKP